MFDDEDYNLKNAAVVRAVNCWEDFEEVGKCSDNVYMEARWRLRKIYEMRSRNIVRTVKCFRICLLYLRQSIDEALLLYRNVVRLGRPAGRTIEKHVDGYTELKREQLKPL